MILSNLLNSKAKAKPSSANAKLNHFMATRIQAERDDITGMGKNQQTNTGQIGQAMDAFYSDYRNAPVCWGDALKFSIMSLDGDAPSDQDLDIARKSDAQSGCK